MSYIQYIEHTKDENNVIEMFYKIAEFDRSEDEERSTEILPIFFEEFLGKNGYLDEDRKEYGPHAFDAFMRDFENQSPAFYQRVFKEYVTEFLGGQIATEIDTIIHHYQLIKNSLTV